MAPQQVSTCHCVAAALLGSMVITMHRAHPDMLLQALALAEQVLFSCLSVCRLAMQMHAHQPLQPLACPCVGCCLEAAYCNTAATRMAAAIPQTHLAGLPLPLQCLPVAD